MIRLPEQLISDIESRTRILILRYHKIKMKHYNNNTIAHTYYLFNFSSLVITKISRPYIYRKRVSLKTCLPSKERMVRDCSRKFCWPWSSSLLERAMTMPMLLRKRIRHACTNRRIRQEMGWACVRGAMRDSDENVAIRLSKYLTISWFAPRGKERLRLRNYYPTNHRITNESEWEER